MAGLRVNRSSKPEKVDLPASARHAWPDSLPPFESVAWVRILAGAFPAFHAFIGFEGMLNVAEEVKNATRALPLIGFLVTFGLPADEGARLLTNWAVRPSCALPIDALPEVARLLR